jgi:CheY-like chemotaxis protein
MRADLNDNGACVLVVDDEPEVRSVCSQALREAGFRVEEAGSAPEAITILEDRVVEIVLSDMCMPDADGLRLLHPCAAPRPGGQKHDRVDRGIGRQGQGR